MKNYDFFLATALLFSLCACVACYPSGAGFSACTTMVPRHGANQPSTELSPYVILVSKSTYQPGDKISVMLRGLCGTEFKGFLVQARRADSADPRYRQNPSQALGQFQAVFGSRYQCGNGQVALTHNGRYNATTLIFNWTAPAQPMGHVQIKATFVANYSSIWNSVASVVIQDPQAAPLSVDADSLRTNFIEPCEIDRPKPPTIPGGPTPNPPPTPPPAPTPPPTTPPPPSPTSPPTAATPAPTAPTTRPPPTSPTTAAAQVMPASPTPFNVDITSTPPSSLTVDDPVIECGKTHGCFRQCVSRQICEFRVAWQARGDNVWFDVMAPPLEGNREQWIALAFSQDHKMGQDSVVECLSEQDRVYSHLSFNAKRENDILAPEESTDMVQGLRMAQRDGYLHCQFLRKMNMTGDSRVFDLERDWHLLLAQGPLRQGRKLRHAGVPVASARLVDLQSLDDVGPWVQDKLLITLHASLMSFAWIFCAGFGIVMARYYKALWPKHQLCGRKVWFTIHRGCMVMLTVLTLAGFIVIFVEAEGMAEVGIEEFVRLHPVLGIIIMLFTLGQILFGIFRPSSTSKNRPVFNWGHWLLGVVSYVLAIFNMGLGLKLRKSGTHDSASYVLYAYAMYTVMMIVCLEIISCNIRIRERKSASYVIYESRSTIYSSAKEIMEGNSSEPPGSIHLRIAIRVHLLFVTAFTAALVALVAIA